MHARYYAAIVSIDDINGMLFEGFYCNLLMIKKKYLPM